MHPVTIGLIGIGDILDTHLRAIEANPAYALTGICRRSPDKLKAQAEKLGVRGYVDYRELLADKPDVALISLPHDLHYPATLEALRNGCHVLIEKPAAVTVAQINDMIEAAGKAGRAILVTDSAYWDPVNRAARALVGSGALGKLLFGSFTNHRYYFTPSRPRWFLDAQASGGGQFMNIGVHRIAGVRCILADVYEETSVVASVHRIHPSHGIEAATQALVRYAGGESVVYEECGYFPPPAELPRGLHFVFEKGMLGIGPGSVWTSDVHGKVTHHEIGPPPAGGPYGALYGEMLKAMEGQEHYPTVRHGARDVRIAAAAYASAETRAPVDLTGPAWRIA